MLLDNATQPMDWTSIEPNHSPSHKKETYIVFPQIAHTHAYEQRIESVILVV